MNEKVRVLIVEDEFITLDSLRDSLEEIGYEISGDAMKAEEALAILDQRDTDIAILDIQLKGEKSGIWLASQIKQKYKIPFIFLSAFSDPKTIQEATQTEPYGYLVKPFTPSDIYAAIEVALKNFSKNSEAFHLPKSHTKVSDEVLVNDAIFVKDDLVFRKIIISEILYIQAFKNYLELHFVGNRHVIRSTLKDFLEILPNAHFMQAHRSYVVNIDRVEKVGSNFVMVGDASIPVSNNYREALLQRLKFFY